MKRMKPAISKIGNYAIIYTLGPVIGAWLFCRHAASAIKGVIL